MVRPVVSTRTAASAGLLVRRGDAGELGDLPPPSLRVEALAVAALALLQRGGDVHEDERPPASSVIARTCCRVLSKGAMGLQMATPPCRLISAATHPIRRMLVSRSALEKVRPAERFRRTTSPSRLVTVRRPCSRTTSCSARARVDLPLPESPVKNRTSPCRDGSGRSCVDDGGHVLGQVALAGDPEDLAGRRRPGRRAHPARGRRSRLRARPEGRPRRWRLAAPRQR